MCVCVSGVTTLYGFKLSLSIVTKRGCQLNLIHLKLTGSCRLRRLLHTAAASRSAALMDMSDHGN